MCHFSAGKFVNLITVYVAIVVLKKWVRLLIQVNIAVSDKIIAVKGMNAGVDHQTVNVLGPLQYNQILIFGVV